MHDFNDCGSPEHRISRRGFLAGVGTGLAFAGMVEPAAAAQLAVQQKRVLLVWLGGGVSQLESWDPKPGTELGGPFQTIATSVPGIHISELLPQTAKQMHHLALIRSLNTKDEVHYNGAIIMHTGRPPVSDLKYPHFGSVCAKLLAPAGSQLPGYLHITTPGAPRPDGPPGVEEAAFLGPRYASVMLPHGREPNDLTRPETWTEASDRRRQSLRVRANERFVRRRGTADTEAYAETYDQAAQLNERRKVFDVSREDPRLRDKYGMHDFGRNCLLARRLLEQGATFVKVSHFDYDTHHENFDFHIERLGEFDQPFAALLDDLHQRDMLQSTLVIVMSEFGRTPQINKTVGRDHWPKAWSVAVGGCGIKGGAVVGKTNAAGTEVVDRMVNAGHLFHTWYRALGLDPREELLANQRPVAMADPEADAITELLP